MHAIVRSQLAKLINVLKYLLRSFVPDINPIDLGKVVRSIPERWLDPTVQKHVIGLHCIRHAGSETYSYPLNVNLAFRSEMHFAKRHVYHLRDLSVQVRTGGCLAGSFYLQETYGSLRRCLLNRPFPNSDGCRYIGRGPVTCFNLTSYYHFLLEEVPRLLWALEQYRDLTIVVHNSASSYIRRVLDLVSKLPDFNCGLIYTNSEVFQFSSYVFTQAEAYSGFVHIDDLLLIRKHLLMGTAETFNAEKKIYVARCNASRSFENEGQVVELMLKNGFEIVTPETMDFQSQVALFRDAVVVVAPHGAGLANLLWCSPGTEVIEIFSPLYFNDCYARLSTQLNLAYRPLWAQEGRGWGSVELSELLMTLDIL